MTQQFHERFAPVFGKAHAQIHSYDYIKGLMIYPERKSVESGLEPPLRDL